MDRCKLEYMIKKADFKIKKAIIQEMDPYGDYRFKKDVSKFLQNPETDDFEILQNLPEVLYIPGEKEKLLNEFREQYKNINELCKQNKVYPFFKDPNNIPESEATRLDIVKIVPEEILNKFFGVESIRDYEPPVYEEPTSECECGLQMGE